MLVCFASRIIHSEGILLKIPQLHGILPGQTPTGTVIKRTVMEDTEGILRFNLKFSDFRNCWSAWKFDKLMNYDEMFPFIWGWKFWLRPYQWVHLETARGAENDEVWVNLLCNCDTFPSISQDPSSFSKHVMYWEIDLQQQGTGELFFLFFNVTELSRSTAKSIYWFSLHQKFIAWGYSSDLRAIIILWYLM